MAAGVQQNRPPVHVILDVVQAAADMKQLLLLDAAWTQAAERSDQLTERDREALVALGSRIDAEVAIVERHAATLQRIFEAHPALVNERVRGELASERFTTPQRDDALRWLGVENDDFARRGSEVAASIAQRAPVERQDIRRKIPALRDEGPVVTDLSHEFVCNVAAGAFIAGVFACPETAGIGCIEAGFAFGFAVGFHC